LLNKLSDLLKQIKAKESELEYLQKEKDSLEIYVPFNELVYCLRPETRDFTRALYWVAWITKYASVFKKQNKIDFVCTARTNSYVDDKYSGLVVWMLWEAILDASRNSPQAGLLHPYIDALFKFHCLRWSPSVQKQRYSFLITTVLMICESTSMDIHYKVPHDLVAIHSLIENIPSWIQAIIQTQKTFSS
jgi:hypothetical protein